MADRQDDYPATATNGARGGPDGEGIAAVREAVDEHGEAIAAAVDATDEADDLYATLVLLLASADEDDLEHVTQSAGALVETADSLTTDEVAALAEQVGTNATTLSASLDTLVELEQAGRLDDLLTLATAATDGLSDEEMDRLAALLEADGGELIDALDTVLALQREGALDDLVDLSRTLSAVEMDAETVAGLNAVLGAVGEAQTDSEPVGLLGTLRALRGRDARAGLGYLVALLQALGRRIRS